MLLLFNHRHFFLKCKLTFLLKFNLVYKSKKKQQNNNCEKRCCGSFVNGICFNKKKFLKLLPSCKSVHALQKSYVKRKSSSPDKFPPSSFKQLELLKEYEVDTNPKRLDKETDGQQLRFGWM